MAAGGSSILQAWAVILVISAVFMGAHLTFRHTCSLGLQPHSPPVREPSKNTLVDANNNNAASSVVPAKVVDDAPPLVEEKKDALPSPKHGHDHIGHVHGSVDHPLFENQMAPVHASPNHTFAITVDMEDKPRFCLLTPTRGESPCKKGTAKSAPLLRFFLPTLSNMGGSDNDVVYEIWFGHDKGDQWYDDPVCANELYAAVDQYLRPNIAFHHIVIDTPVKSSPCFAWNELALAAYKDGCDYLYQANDDTSFKTKNPGGNILKHFMEKNRYNFGMVAPIDQNHKNLATQASVHRNHMEIFGYFYPPTFKNWYSDNYMHHLYTSKYTTLDNKILIKNENGQRKTGERYHIDRAAAKLWRREVDESRDQIREYLEGLHGTGRAAYIDFPNEYMLDVRGEPVKDNPEAKRKAADEWAKQKAANNNNNNNGGGAVDEHAEPATPAPAAAEPPRVDDVAPAPGGGGVENEQHLREQQMAIVRARQEEELELQRKVMNGEDARRQRPEGFGVPARPGGQ